jgi:hypothetical protein
MGCLPQRPFGRAAQSRNGLAPGDADPSRPPATPADLFISGKGKAPHHQQEKMAGRPVHGCNVRSPLPSGGTETEILVGKATRVSMRTGSDRSGSFQEW